MPKSLVHNDGNAIASELERAGLSCGTTRIAHEQLKHFLGAVRSIHRVRCVERAGWHEETYVLASGHAFGPDGDKLVLQSEFATRGDAFTASGSLEEWQTHVAAPAEGNDRLVLSISVNFAGVLIKFLNLAGAGLHFHGKSQIGKTTATCCGASVWGRGHERGGHIRSWRATANGFESVGVQFNDNTLSLEEIGQANAREAGEIVYLLMNGIGKSRMGRDLRGRPPFTYCVTVLSTGEVSLSVKMAEAGLRARILSGTSATTRGQPRREAFLPRPQRHPFGPRHDAILTRQLTSRVTTKKQEQP
jgi:uncharacterized protein (DUF927 family)